MVSINKPICELMFIDNYIKAHSQKCLKRYTHMTSYYHKIKFCESNVKNPKKFNFVMCGDL